MFRRFWVVAFLVLSASCQRNSALPVADKQEVAPATDAAKGEPRAEVGIGTGPERTAKTDPKLTDVGPTFGKSQLLGKDASYFQFGPGGKLILFSTKAEDGPTVVHAVPPDPPDRPIEIARVEQELGGLTVLDPDANQLLLVEVLPKEKGVISSEDLKRLWKVDRTKMETRELKGPWEGRNFGLAETPVSPDGRFIVIEDWRPRTDGDRGNYSVIHIFDDHAGSTQTIELVNQSPEAIGWVGTGKDLRLAFLKNPRWDKEQKQEWYLGEPETGKYTPAEKSPLPSDEWTQRISPDDALLASVEGNDKLTITDAKSGQQRSFEFHEDDRRFVHEESFKWVSPRYLLLYLDRLAFLDVQSMRMSYPLVQKDNSRGHTFSPDFKWVLWESPDGGLYVSPIVMPAGH